MRITTEYVREEVKKRGYKLIGEYINAKTKITLEDEEGYLYSITWDKFKQGQNPPMASPTNPYSIYNIRKYALQFDYELISTEYKNCEEDLIFRCPKGHEYKVSWKEFYKHGSKCNKCAKQVVTLETCIATTDPWMMKYLKNKEDGYNNFHSSHKKIDVICDCCGAEKKMMISNIHKRHSISCSCGDGTSYPEKILISILDQLGVNYIKEYSPEWIDKKRYDFYFEYNDKKMCIIECHGKQHYIENGFKCIGGRSLEEEQENDKYKKELALKNGIDYYIELDCRNSNLEHIKNSILNSELNNIFDLSIIDWLKCEEFALSNRVKEVCDYWHLHNDINNENLSTTDIGEVFNLDRNTIVRYLKRGTKLGWCNYNGKEQMKKNCINAGKSKCKPVEVFKDNKSLGVFESSSELSRQSEELFGVKLIQSSISAVCCGKLKTHKGFTFKYITQQEYNLRKSNSENFSIDVDKMIS